MAEIVVSVDVDAPPETVWAAAIDWERQGDWILATRVWPTGQDGRGVGGRVSAWTGIGPVGFLDTMEITVWRPPYRCEVRHTGRVVRGVGAFEVEPLPGGRARFVWSEWLRLPLGLLGQVGFELVRPFVVIGVRSSLRRFARQAAARRGDAA